MTSRLCGALSKCPVRSPRLSWEPGGGLADTVPIDPSFLSELRDVTLEHGVVLIFDEVVDRISLLDGWGAEVLQRHARSHGVGKDHGRWRIGGVLSPDVVI